MTAREPTWRVVVASGSEIGERPVWDAHTQTLVWVDVIAGRIHHTRPSASPKEAWSDTATTVGDVVGAVAVRRRGGLIAGIDSAIRLLDSRGRDDGDAIPVTMPAQHRFNDGACDPAGRFLIGSAGSTPIGTLWSVGPKGRAAVVLEGITESNGIGWSDDGALLYFIDSGESVVRRYAYDVETGFVGGRLPDLVDLSSRPGVPDGLVIDADGLIWVPQWQGGELACFDATGDVVARWGLPVSQPTCAGFAGSDLDTLILATSWEGMTSETRVDEPWAGHLLAADTPIRGRRPLEYAD